MTKSFESTSIRIGVCAMAKKAMSKPMKEILRRMEKFEHIKLIVFDESVILNDPIEEWPVCDALISFFSGGFPIEKAIAYSKLREPYLVNDLESQYLLMNRKLVYECLRREGIPVPRYACVDRESDTPVNLIEHDDSIEVDGEVFHKPFVEKPLNAEDHNIYIYFPSTAGGGSQRLFRKVGNLSSRYFSHSSIRRTGSYMYEEFMPTDGTDVKVYTVADDYAHAEARKSPALDGKVERDLEGKEVRYPVILTPREKIIAKKVANAVMQQICGFDLLRANGMSYVCDVNGFSFVKSSRKYYDDCSHMLGVLITRKLAPRLCLPTYLPLGADLDTPLVPTTCGTIMELRCVIGVIRHGDRTPKQKMKMEVRHAKFFDLFAKYAGGLASELKLKRPTQLQEVLDIVRSILEELDSGQDADPFTLKNKLKFEQLKYVLEMYGTFSGINRKIQLKYQSQAMPKSKSECTDATQDEKEEEKEGNDQEGEEKADRRPPGLLLIVKWGGELTAAGKQQAETLGRAFRCIYPGGDGHYGKDPGLGLLRLHSTYRHDLKIYASDEGRVQMTAAAFTKGFLALEGELPPILVQMVKSANTNGLLDNDNDCRKHQQKAKRMIREAMQKTGQFTPDDYDRLIPTKSQSLVNAMRFVADPQSACDRLYGHIRDLAARLVQLAASDETRRTIRLYQNESWDLLLRRWNKLVKDFKQSDSEYDFTKISDIYDNIKYDLQHNPGILADSQSQDFFMCAKSLADIIVPQEYGITKEEKLVIGQRICTPLLRKVLSDARYTDVDECTRLHAGYSKGVASPERFVRTRLYFTSESHIHSLMTCLRYGELADLTTDEQWSRAMEYVSLVSELNYLTQFVIMIYEDLTVEPKTEQRFHVELHFSPGAFALCHDIPEGSGFRPGKLERLSSQASVVSGSSTSIGDPHHLESESSMRTPLSASPIPPTSSLSTASSFDTSPNNKTIYFPKSTPADSICRSKQLSDSSMPASPNHAKTFSSNDLVSPQTVVDDDPDATVTQNKSSTTDTEMFDMFRRKATTDPLLTSSNHPLHESDASGVGRFTVTQVSPKLQPKANIDSSPGRKSRRISSLSPSSSNGKAKSFGHRRSLDSSLASRPDCFVKTVTEQSRTPPQTRHADGSLSPDVVRSPIDIASSNVPVPSSPTQNDNDPTTATATTTVTGTPSFQRFRREPRSKVVDSPKSLPASITTARPDSVSPGGRDSGSQNVVKSKFRINVVGHSAQPSSPPLPATSRRRQQQHHRSRHSVGSTGSTSSSHRSSSYHRAESTASSCDTDEETGIAGIGNGCVTVGYGASSNPHSNNLLTNAYTFPHSSVATSSSLDITRLIRASVIGNGPQPVQFCRSLISTAVIRGGSRDESASTAAANKLSIASNSSPQIGEEAATGGGGQLSPGNSVDANQRPSSTSQPYSPSDFGIPSAPSVPEVYPLETLHNALTLSQLEAFLADMITHKYTNSSAVSTSRSLSLDKINDQDDDDNDNGAGEVDKSSPIEQNVMQAAVSAALNDLGSKDVVIDNGHGHDQLTLSADSLCVATATALVRHHSSSPSSTEPTQAPLVPSSPLQQVKMVRSPSSS